MNENNESIKIFRCNICNRNYSSQSSLCNHNKKFHTNNTQHNTHHNINNTHHNNNINESDYMCKYCSKIYKHQQSKSRHEKDCKIKLKNNDIKNNFKKLEQENIEIKNILKELLEKNCKIHPKTLQKINKQLINNNGTINNDDSTNSIKEKLLYECEENKIIKSDDNKFIFDLKKKLLRFYENPIKYFYYNDQVYFKGKDIASMLGYEDTTQAISENVDIEDRIKVSSLSKISEHIENEDPESVFINELGFYSIILVSEKEEVKNFKRWVTSMVLPLIRKTGSKNLIDNYIEEELGKYQNKDCVYIININDNIYKYGYTSHIYKRLQAHKTNLNYKKIIKIYEMGNMNEAINLENKIKKLTKSLNYNIIYNNHIEIFEVENDNLYKIIKKIDEMSLKINNKNKNSIEETKIKQLELENENLNLKLELLKLSK